MRSLVANAALLLTLAASPSSRAADPEPSLETIRAHLDFLADDRLAGRDTGEAGHEIAALYAAAQFRQWGLAPGAGNSYFQRIPFQRTRLAGVALEVRQGSSTVALQWKDDFAMKGSPIYQKVEVAAPVAFAGFGIEAPRLGHSDYGALDARGKIVLVLSGAPESFPRDERAHFSAARVKSEEAARRGALGLLTLKTRIDERRSPWERSVLNIDHPFLRWRHPDGRLQDALPELRFNAILNRTGATKLLAGTDVTLEQLLDAGERPGFGSRELPVTLAVRTESSQEEISSPNVVALLAGSDAALRNEVVVVTAHLDHIGIGAEVEGDRIYNGYYDNAMGSAIVLEMARRLAAATTRPARSLLFVLVTGEEKGLLGSDYFAHYPTVPLAAIVANLNIDMPLFLQPVSDLVAFGGEHSTLGPLASDAARAGGFSVSVDPVPEEVIFVRSDQYSFVRRGIPAIYLNPGLGSRDGSNAGERAVATFRELHYHRPSDEATLGVDWDSVARFVATNLRLALAIADAPERPRWLAGDFFGETFGAAPTQ